MAHELTFQADGAAEMAYVGEKPWHGFGQEIPAGISVEDALKAARMEWQYIKTVAQFTNGSLHEFPGQNVVYRSDNNMPLSIVSDRYKLVQPKQTVEFFRDLISDAGFSIETLGSLKGGRRIWAMASTNIDGFVNPDDCVKAYLMLITSCDGSLATTAKFISTRVVCWNTQSIALKETGTEVKVRHSIEFNPVAVKQELGLLGREAFDSFLSRMRKLSTHKVDSARAEKLLSFAMPIPAGDVLIEETKGFKKIMSLFNGEAKGHGLPGVAGTAWGLLNATTEYVDHHVRAHNPENRFSSAHEGPGAALKADMEAILLEECN